jgi:hypothetical protein
MKVPQSIPISIFVFLQITVSSIVGFFFVRRDFWPGIDALAPVQNLGNVAAQHSTDLFTNSSLKISGRTPYNLLLKFIDALLPFDSDFALSVLSSITIMFSVSLVFLAIMSMMLGNLGSKKQMVPSTFFIAYLIYIFGSLFVPKLPYGSSIYLADYGPFPSPWSTPEFLSMVLNGFGIIVMKISTNNKTGMNTFFVFFVLSSATFIHPASSFFFLTIISTIGICFRTINRQQIYIIGSALLVCFLVLSLLFNGESTTLSSYQFVEIYSKLRHPHHFVPSTYLNLGNVIIYLSTFLFSLVLCRKSYAHRNALLALFAAFIFSNFVQFFFVEVTPVRLIAAFGASRINSYVLISCYVIFVHFVLTNNAFCESVKKYFVEFVWVINSKLIVVLSFIVFCFTANFVYSDYIVFKSDTLKEAQDLKLYAHDLILVESNVVTEGYREFAHINIWFDDYFMFELEGIKIYRNRWLQTCGKEPITKCKDLLINGSMQSLYEMMDRNGIQKLVTSRPLDESRIHSKFVFLGYSENKWSYELNKMFKEKWSCDSELFQRGGSRGLRGIQF